MAAVTVVMPAYNHEKFVGEAVESVLAQTMDDWELLVVDDGSTDKTAEVVMSFRDPRVRLIRQLNRGAHHALNRGLEEAAAPWVAILNSDDRFRRDKLERHLAYHDSNPVSQASACRVRYILETGMPASRYSYYSVRYRQMKNISGQMPFLFASLLVANHLVTTSCLFAKRDILLQMGGFIGLRFVHDWFMFLALARVGTLCLIEDELTDYRRHPMNTIAENDLAGLIEDNFVLEWFAWAGSELSDASLVEPGKVPRLLRENGRADSRLMAIFRSWRLLNNNDLGECSRIFEDDGHAILAECRAEIRRKLFSRRLSRAMDHLSLLKFLIMERM